MSEFEQAMEGFDEAWDEGKAQAGSGGGAMLPAGEYEARVDIARIIWSDRGECWQWELKFVDVGGQGSVRNWCNLDNEVGIKIAAGYAKIMGYDGDLKSLGAACESGMFIDKLVLIKVEDKPKDDGTDGVYKRVYVNRDLGQAPEPGAGHDRAPVPDDDDIPFAFLDMYGVIPTYMERS